MRLAGQGQVTDLQGVGLQVIGTAAARALAVRICKRLGRKVKVRQGAGRSGLGKVSTNCDVAGGRIGKSSVTSRKNATFGFRSPLPTTLREQNQKRRGRRRSFFGPQRQVPVATI